MSIAAVDGCSWQVLRIATGLGGTCQVPVPAATPRRLHNEVHFATSAAAATATTSTSVMTPPRGRVAHAGGGPGGYDDVVLIMGATGTGKSKLSIDLGQRYPAEVVNSDKMQVYRGLDITTNKLPFGDRGGVPHHLLGELEPDEGVITAGGFRALASRRISAIRARRRVPFIAGGSNRMVCALVGEEDEDGGLCDPFGYENKQQHHGGANEGSNIPWPLRYRCCFLWVDVCWSVLEQYLDRRVDEMVTMGMVDELARYFDRQRAEAGRYAGLEEAIGVPEFDEFFLHHPPRIGMRYDGRAGSADWQAGERDAYEASVYAIKVNTRVLARRQVGRIERMQSKMGWDMRRLDATEAVARKLERRRKGDVEEAWERDVFGPAQAEVNGFLIGDGIDGLRRSWRTIRNGGFGAPATAAAVEDGAVESGGEVALVVGRAQAQAHLL